MQKSISCIICRKQFYSKGFSSHYISAHTKEGNEMRKKCGALSLDKCTTILKVQKEQRITEYNKNPTKCLCCNTIFDYNKRHNKFCNSSCSTIYNNKHRDNNSNIKTSNALKLKYKNGELKLKPKEKLNYSRISFCEICGTIIHNKHVKSCSDRCYKLLLSKNMRSNLYHMQNVSRNRGRHKKSYLEKSFKQWLLSSNYVNFIDEYTIKDTTNKKSYFADFFFPSLNLIIELDGSQHKNTIIYDQERDSIISRLYGYKIIRISHKEYINKSRLSEIKTLLNIN